MTTVRRRGQRTAAAPGATPRSPGPLLLGLNAVGALVSAAFAVRGARRPGYVQPRLATGPLASFWAASSAVRTLAITAVLLSTVRQRRAAPELLAVAGLVQLGDAALGLWQRKPDMTLAPAAMAVVHLASAHRPPR